MYQEAKVNVALLQARNLQRFLLKCDGWQKTPQYLDLTKNECQDLIKSTVS